MNFKKVVEAGSINRASRLLYISQPALSKCIKLLEQSLQVPLLERGAKGVRPTVYGDELYETACRIEHDFLKGLKRIHDEKIAREPSRESLDINIGCSTIWTDVLLPEVMKGSEEKIPYKINMTQDTSEQLLLDLSESDKYDFVLCRIIENKEYKNLHFEPLIKSQVTLFADENHPAFSSELRTADLNQLRWIKLKSLPLPTEEDLTEEGLQFFPKNFFPPSVSFEVEDLMAAVQLLRSHYVTLLPLGFDRILKRYGIKPLPLPRDLMTPYWLGLVKPRKKELPLFVSSLINTICLFFSRTFSKGDF